MKFLKAPLPEIHQFSVMGKKPKKLIYAGVSIFGLILIGLSWLYLFPGGFEPTPDPDSEHGIYIPTNLEDCHKELDRGLSLNTKASMYLSSKEGMIKYHFGLGMWLRNNWGLWGGSRLSKYFRSIGMLHPDDMSGVILDSYWHHLHGKNFDLQREVDYYRAYWEAAEKSNK